MKNCPFCGNEINDSAILCVRCGADLNSQPKNISNSKAVDKYFELIKMGLILVAVSFFVSFVWGMLSSILWGNLNIDYSFFSIVNLVISWILNIAQVVGIALAFVGYCKAKK